MYDCHLHTHHSFDGRNTMKNICKESIEHGMKGICFTNHLDLNAVNRENPGEPIDHYPDSSQSKDFAEAKSIYGDQLEMCLGAEVGLQLGQGERSKAAIAQLKPDFIIGSVHYIDNTDVYAGGFSVGKDKFQTYMSYLERILEIVKTHDYFHVLGHLDMILRDKKFTDKSMDLVEYRLLIDDILKTLIDNGKGIEVNSSGWRYNLGGPHPQPFIIKRYKELGGTIITTGSDSHFDDSINSGIERATILLKEIGFSEVSYFVNGEEQRRKI